MAEVITTVMSAIATNASRLPDLTIKNGQLIFVKDKHFIALDIGNKRNFFNQITILQTENERTELLAPIGGSFYFVVSNAVLWFYDNGWKQLTTPPEEIVFIGTSLPEFGASKTLYVNRAKKNISVWDDESSSYEIVADVTREISVSDIDNLFN